MKKLLLAATLAFATFVAVTEARAQAPSSPAGAWEYTLDTGDSPMTGTITLTDSSGVLGGTIASSDGQVLALQDVALAQDTLTFAFTSPMYGPGTAQLALAGETFKGRLSVPAYGRFPVRGARRVASGAPPAAVEARAVLSTRTRLRELFQNEEAKAVLEKHVPGLTTNPQIDQAMELSLRDVAPYAPDTFTEQVLRAIDEDLSRL